MKWLPSLKVIAATVAFAAVHSALASRQAKDTAIAALGARNANGLYRVFYIAQSVGTIGLLVKYIRKQPSSQLYYMKGGWGAIMRAGQLAALLNATAGARQVGFLRITGCENFAAWIGAGPVKPMPEAQGPGLDKESADRASGPFAWSRHPLNFSPLPVFWLAPRMTTNLLAFNVASTCYLVVGSYHEESRLRSEDGDGYERYRSSGIPFFLPTLAEGALAPIDHHLQDGLGDDS
jgi:methanethiol S-methyltransferase